MALELSGYEKAAILLLAIGENAAVEVLKVLDQKDIRAIGAYLGGMVNVGQDEHRTVLREFVQQAGASGLSVEGKTYLSKILNSALGKDKARRILSSLNTSENAGFETLKSMDSASIANMLTYEHPQTGALILSNLESDQSGQVLALLPSHKRDAIVYRMATTEEVSPNMLDELNGVLQDELRTGASKNAVAVGGTGLVAEILNSVKRNVEGEIMAALEEKNAEIAEEIRSKMFVFEDLEDVDDRGMQEVLRDVSKEELILALKAVDEGLKEKFFKNMSSRAAESLKEDMDSRGPVKLSDVESAQQNILKIVQKMAAEGRVVLGGKGEEQMV
ncbi:MAG: flagellar motor switch protein FliG [Nitrospirales bacterium]|nr:MAG: flagellar motor switch protein FliG [Nitrospirales bacterium]